MNELRAQYELLGLSPLADDAEIHAARRRVAFEVHPDRGGTTQAMAAVNSAFAAIMKARRSPDNDRELADSGTIDTENPGHRLPNSVFNAPSRSRVWSSDTPSFSINVLPVEAFEYLLLAAQELGDIADSDPPYLLEVAMHVPATREHQQIATNLWCRLEVVPDAGSSTINLICEVSRDLGLDAEWCRDQWIEVVNALDSGLSC